MSLPLPAALGSCCFCLSLVLGAALHPCRVCGTNSYFHLHFHLFPSHLDNHSLWEPKIFATCCFRIIMYSIQVGSWRDSGWWHRLGMHVHAWEHPRLPPRLG